MAGSTNEQQAESLFPWEAEGGEKRGGREAMEGWWVSGGGGGREIERGQSESVLKMGGRNKEGGGGMLEMRRGEKKQTRRINKKE